MDPKIFGIFSAAFSAIVAAISYYAKTRHELRRATRTVLYYLLELHHLISRIQFGVKQFPSSYVDYCKSSLSAKGHNVSEADAKYLQETLLQLIRQLGKSELEELTTRIADPLAKAIADLSREDPVLAFRIRGKGSITKTSQLLRSLANSDVTAATISTTKPEEWQRMLVELDDLSLEIAVTELSGCIRLVAWHCDVLTHARVLLLLRRASSVRTIEDINARASNTIETFVTRALEIQTATKESGATRAEQVSSEQIK